MTSGASCNLVWNFGRKSSLITEKTESESLKSALRDMNLTEGLRVSEAGIRLPSDTVCNEQRTAATELCIVRCLISCS